MNVQIKPHQVVLEYHESDPRGDDAYAWAQAHAGREEMDWGDWHVTCFSGIVNRTYIYRFVDSRTAVMFKLTWAGK